MKQHTASRGLNREGYQLTPGRKIRKEIKYKQKLPNFKSQQLIGKKMFYKNRQRTENWSARRDKRTFAENLAKEAGKATVFGNLGTV